MDLLKEFEDILCHNLFCYSKDWLMNTPKEKYVKQWKETKEKISLVKEIMKDVKLNIQEDIWYLVRNEELEVLGSFSTLNQAIVFAEKKKKENMRNCDSSEVWVEIEGESEKIYIAKDYENVSKYTILCKK